MSVANGSGSVSTTSVQVLPNRYGQRLDYVIINTGTTNLTIARGDAAAVDKAGIYLLAPGGSVGAANWGEGSDAGILCWQGAVQIISDAAGGTYGFTERLRN